MTTEQNLRWQLISAWCGPVFVVLFVPFWGWIGSYYFPYFAWLSWFGLFSYFIIRAINRDRVSVGTA